MQDLSLEKLDGVRMAIEAATSAQEIQGAICAAKAAEVYARQAKLGKDIQSTWAEYVVRAERKLGEMLIDAKAAGQITHAHDPRHKPKPVVPDENNRSFTLAEAGIDRKLSSRSQKIAAIPKDEFEEKVATLKKSGTLTPKSVVRKDRTNGEKPNRVPKPHYRETEIVVLSDSGSTQSEIAAHVGISKHTVRDILEKGRIRRGADPQITPDDLSMTAQQRLELAIRQHKEKLDSEFHKAVNARVEEFLEQTIMPKLQEEQDEARRIMKSRKGVMDRKAYRKILSCLHPDKVTDPDQKEVYVEAFLLFTKIEKLVLDEKESPTQFVNIPKTQAEWEEVKRKAAIARKAKRTAGRGLEISK